MAAGSSYAKLNMHLFQKKKKHHGQKTIQFNRKKCAFIFSANNIAEGKTKNLNLEVSFWMIRGGGTLLAVGLLLV